MYADTTYIHDAASVYGPPLDPEALVGGATDYLAARSTPFRPQHLHQVCAELAPHLAEMAARALGARKGKPPKTAPKVAINILIATETGAAAELRKVLRDVGPANAVRFDPEFYGIGAEPAGIHGTWIHGVDGTDNPSEGNIRSWRNRLRVSSILFAPDTMYPLILHFAVVGSAAVYRITTAAATSECARYYERYRVVNAGNRLYLVCFDRRLPVPAVGTAIYDAIVAAAVAPAVEEFPGYTAD